MGTTQAFSSLVTITAITTVTTVTTVTIVTHNHSCRCRAQELQKRRSKKDEGDASVPTLLICHPRPYETNRHCSTPPTGNAIVPTNL
jgi:hypothetical protein